MMKKIITTLVLTMATSTALANGGYGAVAVDKHGFETSTFWCQNKTYFSDIPLKDFQGCDVQPVTVGSGGQPGKLIMAYHGWETLEDGSQSPIKTVFVEMPNGDLYRLKSTYFLTSPLLQHYFAKQLGRPESLPKDISNLILGDFSTRNLQLYGTTFCVEHYLKRPFKGVVGWCQGDRVVGGEVDYVDGALSFPKAAILAQNYVYDNALPVKDRKLFHHDTRIALNKDREGREYWAFGVPAMNPNRLLGMYSVRVYMNGYIEFKEYAGKPNPSEL